MESGGNTLNVLGPVQTVECIMEVVKKAKWDQKDVKVAVMSIFQHPKEDRRYDNMRKEANKKLQMKICELKAELILEKGGNLSFMDMDAVVSADSFTRDGLHVNANGDARVGKSILQWMREKSRCKECDD